MRLDDLDMPYSPPRRPPVQMRTTLLSTISELGTKHHGDLAMIRKLVEWIRQRVYMTDFVIWLVV